MVGKRLKNTELLKRLHKKLKTSFITDTISLFSLKFYLQEFSKAVRLLIILSLSKWPLSYNQQCSSLIKFKAFSSGIFNPAFETSTVEIRYFGDKDP